MTDLLAENAEALEWVHEAGKARESRYPLDFTQGAKITLPALTGVRHLVMLLQLEAILHAECGDAKRAVESLITSLGAGHSLSKELLLISRWVEVGCREVTLRGIGQIIERVELSRE